MSKPGEASSKPSKRKPSSPWRPAAMSTRRSTPGRWSGSG